MGLFSIHGEHPMRAYDGAGATTKAAVFIVDQRGNAWQVPEILHFPSPETVLETVLLAIPKFRVCPSGWV
jgi:hypothetical protein